MAHCLLVLILLLATDLWLSCECAPLETTIAGRSGSTSCVGDTVTYTCTLPATSQRWRIPSLGLDVSITRSNPTFSNSQLTIVTTADEGGANPITTELTVTSSAALNGATITCSDANNIISDFQETTSMVFGSPSAPGLTVVAGGDLASYDFTIIPSSPSECVLNYIITATSSDGSRDITVNASRVDGSTPVNEGGFDVCTVMYSFTVAPVTSEGTGNSSASLDRGPSNSGITPLVVIQQQPTGNVTVTLQGVEFVIGRSSPGGSDCVDVATVDGNEFMEYIVQLDCSYDDVSVTICVRYTAGGCSSMETRWTTMMNIGDDVCPPSTTPTLAEDAVCPPTTPTLAASNLYLAVSLPIAILLSLLAGFLLGMLVMWCGTRKCASRASPEQSMYTVPPNPVYEEVSQDRGHQGVSVECKTNEAYGHVR